MVMNIHRPEREITQAYLVTVAEWIQRFAEVFVVMRYLRAAGAKDYAFVRAPEEFDGLVAKCPIGTDIIVFRDPKLPLRGCVNAEYVEKAKALVPDGQDYMYVRLTPEKPDNLRLSGRMGDCHADLIEDFNEEFGRFIAFGHCPRFFEDDNDAMISASKGGIDGPR